MGSASSVSAFDDAPRLSSLRAGTRAIVRRVLPDRSGRAERLLALA